MRKLHKNPYDKGTPERRAYDVARLELFEDLLTVSHVVGRAVCRFLRR